jgi:hypothetical protein
MSRGADRKPLVRDLHRLIVAIHRLAECLPMAEFLGD